MAEKATELSLILRAKDAASKTLVQIRGQLKKVTDFAVKNKQALKDVGRSLLLAGSIATGFFGVAIHQAAKFEQSIQNVGAVANASAGDMDRLKSAAREMGATTAFSASQAAEAQLLLAQAGQKTADIVETLPGLIQLAASQSADLGLATALTTSTLAQFQLQASESARVSNVFAAATSVSRATLESLSLALRQAGAVASGFGLNLEQTTAAIAALIATGSSGEQAGTRLRGIMASLAAPVGEAVELLSKYGISAMNAEGNLLPLVEIVRQFEQANVSATNIMRIFGQEAGPGMISLLKIGSEGLAEYERAITGTNEAARQAKERLNSFTGQITILKSSIEEVLISVGEVLLPLFKDFASVVQVVVGIFNSLHPVIKILITAFAVAVTVVTLVVGGFTLLAAAIGGVMTVLAPLIATLGITASALGLVVITIVGAIYQLTALIAGWSLWRRETRAQNEELEKINRRIKDHREEQEKARETIEKLTEEIKELKKAKEDAESPESIALIKKAREEEEKAKEATEKLRLEIQKLKAEKDKLLGTTEESNDALKEHADAANIAADAQGNLVGNLEKSNEEMEAQKKAAEELAKAYSRMGIRDVAKETGELNKAFELVKESGTASAQQLALAYSNLQEKLKELNDHSAQYRQSIQAEINILQQRKAFAQDALQGEIAAAQALGQMAQASLDKQRQALDEVKKLKKEIEDIAQGGKDFEFELSLQGLGTEEAGFARLQRAQEQIRNARRNLGEGGAEGHKERVQDLQEAIRLTERLALGFQKGSEQQRQAIDASKQARATLKAEREAGVEIQKKEAAEHGKAAEQFNAGRNAALQYVQVIDELDAKIKALKVVMDTSDFDKAKEEAKKLRQSFARIFGKTITQEVAIVQKRIASGGGSVEGGDGGEGGAKPEGDYAVGIRNVPRDMLANLHRGEAVLTASQAKQFRSGGSGGGLAIRDINIVLGANQKLDRQTIRSEVIPELALAARRKKLKRTF